MKTPEGAGYGTHYMRELLICLCGSRGRRAKMLAPKKDKLPRYCEGCARRESESKCAGWRKPSGCRGEQWASSEQVEKEEKELLDYIGPVSDCG